MGRGSIEPQRGHNCVHVIKLSLIHFFPKVIKAKRKKREEGNESSKRDLLSLLMDQQDEETGATMDDELLRAQVFTFMLAGHETTSVSMMWTLYELARHPDIAKQVRKEIQLVMKDSSELTWAKLAESKFLGNVIKESLRLHPPATMAVRVAKESDVIGGYEIPKGAYVSLGIDVVHHSTKFWKDPHAFDPQRFDENGKLYWYSLLFSSFTTKNKTNKVTQIIL